MASASTFKVTVMPAGHGDCILVQCDTFNILVDSGPYDVEIHNRVRAALETALGEEPVHLAIVTHQDADHIGGLKRMLKVNKPPVHALLFNSPLRIQSYIDDHCDDEMPASARQALAVARELSPYNKEAIVAGDEYKFLDDRIVISVLTPHKKDILDYGEETLASIEGEEYAGGRGRDTPVCGTVEQLLAMQVDDFDEDDSKPNLLSLAFVLTFDNRSILFLGDSWPSRVTSSLSVLTNSGKRLPSFGLMFVSHHGSKRNSTIELYRQIETANYVISTDGKQNPDIETIARILQASPRPAQEVQFHFSENSAELRSMFNRTQLNVTFPENYPLFFTFKIKSYICLETQRNIVKSFTR